MSAVDTARAEVTLLRQAKTDTIAARVEAERLITWATAEMPRLRALEKALTLQIRAANVTLEAAGKRASIDAHLASIVLTGGHPSPSADR